MDTLIIYSPNITSRLKYVLKIVFHEIYQIDYQLTHQRENYLSSEATKINYSANQIINDEIHILPSELLFQIGIREVELGFFKFNDVEYLFKSNNDKAYLHDIFASIFYLISRYEEYSPHLKDKYGRYLHTESIAYKNLSHTNSNVATLIKRIADFSLVGIYPSFASNLKVDILKEEVSRLENIQKREVLFSRQHFLKLSLPATYNRLLSLGIYEDYTMGYASALGFRAGIASP